MKLGFATERLSDIDKAARLGFESVEIRCEAFGDAKAGVLDAGALERARALASDRGIEITALAYYGLEYDPPIEDEIERVYGRVFDAAAALGVSTVASMSGFDADLDWEQNMALFARRFQMLAGNAEARGLRLALENWVGYSGQLPFRPKNMGGSPDTWTRWFEAVPSLALGLEFDPSHLQWQGIDPVRALIEFRDRIYHFHAKDVEVLAERRYRYGVNGDIYRFRIPGYGEIDWMRIVSTLAEIGYEGGIAIENEDEVFGWKSRAERLKAGEEWTDALYDDGLLRGKQVLAPMIHPAGDPSSPIESAGR
jgi:sugar phosphate isomerase/epimerase